MIHELQMTQQIDLVFYTIKWNINVTQTLMITNRIQSNLSPDLTSMLSQPVYLQCDRFQSE